MLVSNESEAREYVASRCSPEALHSLDIFADRLREANAQQNLVSASTLSAIWVRHFADSAQLLDHVGGTVSRETRPWLDLGSGAGFPGLIIAILRPERAVVLVESRRLRIQWLNEAISHMKLTNCRVEGRDVRKVETFEASVISARAFAPLPQLVALSARFSTHATEWVLPKGRSAEQDIMRLPEALQSRFHVKQSLTDQDAKIIVAQGKFEGVAA